LDTSTAYKLIELNRRFYDTFAAEYANSRSAFQPGIPCALAILGHVDSVLDVGCGDGRVARALAAGSIPNASAVHYVGVDFSPKLIGYSPPPGSPLLQADISQVGWPDVLAPIIRTLPHIAFDAIVCFSVLHHLPGADRQLRLLREMHSLVKPAGRLALSVWQFLHVPRLQRKVVRWEEVGLTSAEVDSGDYLLDWQRGGRGLRYVHQFDEAELVDLCARAGFEILETFRSDGATGDMGFFIIAEAN